jgi:quinol monooxygenase YgiN
VFWRLKDASSGNSREENACKLKTMLENLQGKIPEIKRLEVGIDFNRSEAASDVALYSEFTNKEALEKYQQHPEHMKVVAFVKEISSERRVVDYLT